MPRPKSALTRESNLEFALEKAIDVDRRTILLTGEIDEKMFQVVDAALSEMEAVSQDPVTIKINCGGGEVYHALAIVGRLRESPCDITTKGYGMVMSSATLILACGDHRLMSKYGWFMTHEQSYSIDESRQSTIKSIVTQAEREEKVWAGFMSEFTDGDSFEFWLKSGIKVDAYFSPNELVNLRVVDEIF